MTTAAIVLAAGGSSRFGDGHKLLAELRGRPLLVWAVEAAVAAEPDDVLVVTGAVELDHLLPYGVHVVVNPSWAEGQATSLLAGIDAAASAGHDAVVVGLGDQPFVGPLAWRATAATTSHPIAVATYDGRRRNPVRLAAEVWPLLPRTGDEGARLLMAERPELVAEVACPGDPADVDAPEDLTRWS